MPRAAHHYANFVSGFAGVFNTFSGSDSLTKRLCSFSAGWGHMRNRNGYSFYGGDCTIRLFFLFRCAGVPGRMRLIAPIGVPYRRPCPRGNGD